MIAKRLAQRTRVVKRNYQLFFHYSEPRSISPSETIKIEELFNNTLFAKDVIIVESITHELGVELLVELVGDMALSKAVNSLKTLTSRQSKIKCSMRKKGLWKRGYSAFTIGTKNTFK